MKAKTIQSKQNSWAISPVEIAHDEFIAEIKRVENGSFYTMEELQALRLQWRNQKKK